MLFDEEGRALRAIGVLEELPRSFHTLGPAGFIQRLPEGMASDLILRLRADLELDTVEESWLEGTDMSRQAQEAACSGLLRLEWQKVFRQDAGEGLLPYFDREKLLERFRAGQRWLCAEYRRVDGGGVIRWARYVVSMAEDPVSRHICLFAYLISLDPGQLLTPYLQESDQRDPVSRLYTRESIQRIAGRLFARRAGGNRAVAFLQAGGLPFAAVEKGLEERLRYEFSAALSLVMGGSCLLGQYSPTQVVILFPSVPSKEDLRRRIEEGMACLHRMLQADAAFRSLRLTVGVSLLPAGSARYLPMLAQAFQTCILQLDAAADTVAFAQEVDDWGWTQLSSGAGSQVAVQPEEFSRALSAGEKDAAMACMEAMLAARTLDTSLSGVLRVLGDYYQADRVYILMLVEDRRALVMTYEWAGPGKRNIQQVVSGMPLERFPLLQRCLDGQAPVSLYRGGPEGAEGKAWYYTAFPLIREGEVDGFLCIENPRIHPEDAALFGKLIPYMLLERERFQSASSSAVRRLMEMPDRHAFLEMAQAITPEKYNTMGAVCLDVPSLSGSGGGGFENDSRTLWYVAKTLSNLFGGGMLFRVWESEFVAFYPNTTREVFLGRCGRLRSVMMRNCPRQVRIGRAWADRDFTGWQLAEEARSAMRLAISDPAVQAARLIERIAMDPQPQAPDASRFAVYFQPKVDMRTGALIGAEALVRGLSEDGKVIPPAQFIGALEADGAIRDLDLLVLERSLAQVDQWRQEGMGTVHLAVNLSRVTIAHPSTLASILALQSRYPGIPPEALELEITERGDGLDNAELQRIVEQFHSFGLRLSLDDFGSQYANLPLFTDVKFDTVKLDRSLITGATANPISRTLVRDIVWICKEFQMDCVAEGVETGEQAAALLEMGCTCVQGYFFDKPLPAAEFAGKYLRGRAAEGAAKTKEEKV